MAFTLSRVVPWGRSYREYAAMFALTADELRTKSFLDCGGGPANFNATLTKCGGRVISVDPLYHCTGAEIEERIRETSEEVLEQTRKNSDEFVWRNIASVEELGRVRLKAMTDFLADYQAGLKTGRYVEASLPALPFEHGSFDLALCSHFLFLYSAHFSEDFHVDSIKELCRAAREARIFPLLELGAKPSRHLKGVVRRLAKDGFTVAIEKVPYEFQKGGNEMLKVTAL